MSSRKWHHKSKSCKASVIVKDVEAEIEKSGNSVNFVEAEQAAAAAAGFIAVAAAITGGVNIDLNSYLAQAMESDQQYRKQMLEMMKSVRR